MLIVTSRIRVPLDELKFTYARSGGPGGQNVNKVNSKAVLRWNVRSNTSLPDEVRQRFLQRYAGRVTGEGDVMITSTRYRDQGRNADDCLEKLRELIAAVAERPIPRKKTKPTRGSIKRRREAKQERTQRKQGRKSPRVED